MGAEMSGDGIVGCLGTGVRSASSVRDTRDTRAGCLPWRGALRCPTRLPRKRGVPCVPPLCGPGLTPVFSFCHRGRTLDPRGSAGFLLTGSPHAATPGVPSARGPTGSRPRAPECRGWFIRGRAFLIWFGWIYFWEPVAWQWARDAQGHASPTDHLSAPIPGMGSGGRASHPGTLAMGTRALQGEGSQPEQDFGGMEKMGTPSWKGMAMSWED